MRIMIKSIIAIGILCLGLGVLGANRSFADQIEFADITVADGSIKNLEWDQEFSRYQITSSGLEQHYSVRLFGAFRRPGWSLFLKNESIPLGGDGVFQVTLPLVAPVNRFTFIAQGPKGEKESVTILFYGPNAAENEWKVLKIKRWFIAPALAYSSITTKQTGLTDYSTTALTAKLSVNYRLKPNVWDLGGSVFGTVWQLSKNKDIKVNYLGANLRAGYLFPAWNDRWFLSLYGGWYFSSMSVQDQLFGFQNVNGPQIYPSVRYSLAENRVISGYFKFSPISNQLQLLSLTSREIATGLTYTHLLENFRSVSVGFDLSDLILVNGETTVATKTYSLGVQFGF
jgi:hypothetical protein